MLRSTMILKIYDYKKTYDLTTKISKYYNKISSIQKTSDTFMKYYFDYIYRDLK
jgi:hypothetical protein